MKLVRLRTEGFAHPLAIAEPSPRFSWRVEDAVADTILAECQLVVRNGDSVVWDSGLRSNDLPHAPYLGPALEADTEYHWSVTVRTNHGEVTTESAVFTTAPATLDAHWIQGDLAGGPRASIPAPHFRKEFSVPTGVTRARLHVTALGVYDVFLNGQRVNGDFLSPGWTDYRKRVRYQTYDVTDRLTNGVACLGAVIGDGWYCGHVEWQGRQFYGDRPAFLAQLVIESDSGVSVVSTGPDWTHAYGPIVAADILMGEHHDYRLAFGNWSLPGFDDPRWRAAETVEPKIGVLQPYGSPPVRATERIRPISIEKKGTWPKPLHVINFGQNLVGRVRLRLSGSAGTTIRIRHAERLESSGHLYLENLRSAAQTDYVTLGEGQPEWFEPTFTFHGFQYVDIQGYEGELTSDDIEAVVLHSDYEMEGDFACSDPLVTQLWKNIRWGWRGNSVDLPTDCPQRDERLGWTGDAQVFIRTSTMLADVATFWEKYQTDLLDAQLENGAIPPTAPTTEIIPGSDGGPAWSDAVIICPWTVYQTTGDLRILERNFALFERYFRHLESIAVENIRSHPSQTSFRGFGDWLNIEAETQLDLLGTAFFALDARLLGEIADLLGNVQRATHYRQRAFEIKEAFLRRFITGDGLCTSRTQTAYVLALYFDLLPDDFRETAMQELVDDIGRRGYKLSTGFVGSPYLNHVLYENGRPDIAFRLLHQTQWPSWLYAVTQGATTIWERWDGWTHDKGYQDKGMNSFNHYAYGAIGDWLMRVVAGIELDSPGFRRIRLQPNIGGELTEARGEQPTPFGLITSEWRKEGSEVTWRFSIPAGVEASLPEVAGGGTAGSGTHERRWKI